MFNKSMDFLDTCKGDPGKAEAPDPLAADDVELVAGGGVHGVGAVDEGEGDSGHHLPDDEGQVAGQLHLLVLGHVEQVAWGAIMK